GYRGAVLGYSMQVRSVGIDAEPHGPLPDGVLDAVSVAAERDWLTTVDSAEMHWDRLLFCAKEATYKAWEPLTGRWLGFEDAHITFEKTSTGDVHSGTFHSELLVPGNTLDGPPLTSFDGRWLVEEGLIVTAIAVS
ncbi:MAG: 4'-phosphopantetheinyl transferase superfamily protein, partial [Rhodococcus sp. (in: high G+C Gram-positive bacteria)]